MVTRSWYKIALAGDWFPQVAFWLSDEEAADFFFKPGILNVKQSIIAFYCDL